MDRPDFERMASELMTAILVQSRYNRKSEILATALRQLHDDTLERAAVVVPETTVVPSLHRFQCGTTVMKTASGAEEFVTKEDAEQAIRDKARMIRALKTTPDDGGAK